MNPFNKYLLSACWVRSSVLGAGNNFMKKTSLCPHEVYNLCENYYYPISEVKKRRPPEVNLLAQVTK